MSHLSGPTANSTNNVVSIPTAVEVLDAYERRGATLKLVRMDEVQAERVDWLWRDHLARGKLTLLAGDPGIGKSQISVDWAARMSVGGKWPDGTTAPTGATLIISAEDAAGDTIRPRLEAAGADLGRVHVLTETLVDGRTATFSLQDHLRALGAELERLGDVVLVVIDPLNSYMGRIDSHRTTDVRAVLEPLAAFAEEHDVAVLAISHPPKAAQSKALYAVTGSLAFVAAARLVFMAARDQETDRRLLLGVKNNLGPVAPGVSFDLEVKMIGDGIPATRVVWDGSSVTTTADEVVAGANGTTAAVRFLREELAKGPRGSNELKEAATEAGLSWITVRRAQTKLKIEPRREGFGADGGWIWELPE
jgi:putative DNA primase/helicase